MSSAAEVELDDFEPLPVADLSVVADEATSGTIIELEPDSLDEILDVGATAITGYAPELEGESKGVDSAESVQSDVSIAPNRNRTPNTAGASKRDAKAGEDSMRKYLTEIGLYPLLTKEEEYKYAKEIKAGELAQSRLTNPEAKLSTEEKRDLEEKAAAGEWAKRTFIQSNLRLVVSIATHYQGSGLPLLDLIQEGNLGLMHAVEKFEEEKGFKFSTYATFWIKQAIGKGIAEKDNTIHIPGHNLDRLASLYKAENRLTVQLGRSPTLAELAEDTNFSAKTIEKLRKHPHVARSLNEPVGEDDGFELMDVLPDRTSESLEETVEETVRIVFQKGLVAEILSVLLPREREVIIRRWGLEGHIPSTLEEVGRVFSVTRERIRQIEAKSLNKMLNKCLSLRIDPADFLDI